MAKRSAQSAPKWKDVKAKIENLDRLELTGLIQDLYAADKENQTFLHTRFGLGGDVLKPYKKDIDRWLCPNYTGKQDDLLARLGRVRNISHKFGLRRR